MGNNSQRENRYRHSNPLPLFQAGTVESEQLSQRPSSCSFLTCMPRSSHARVSSAQVMPSLEKRIDQEESGSYIVSLKRRTSSICSQEMQGQLPFSRLALDRWLEEGGVPQRDVEVLGRKGSALLVPDIAQNIYEELIQIQDAQVTRNVLNAPIRVSAKIIDALDRQMVLKRLVEIWAKTEFTQEALHLAISYLDKMIEAYYPDMDVFQLRVVMVTSLLVASKVDQKICKTRLSWILRHLTEEERTYITKEIVLQTEETLLTQLDFDLNIVTPFSFLERQLELAQLNPKDKILKKARKLLLLFRFNASSIEIKPSLQAASCLWKGAQLVWKKDPVKSDRLKREWLSRHEKYLFVSVSEISDATLKLNQAVRESSNFQLKQFRQISAKNFY